MSLNRKNVAAFVALALVPACGASTQKPRNTMPAVGITASLGNGRVMPAALELPSGGLITFVNNDERAHQIYSGNNPGADAR